MKKQNYKNANTLVNFMLECVESEAQAFNFVAIIMVKEIFAKFCII